MSFVPPTKAYYCYICFWKLYFNSSFLKLVQCQTRLNCEIQLFVVEEVNHANQNSKEEGVNQVPQKWSSFKAIFISLQSGLPIDLMNTPMSRVSCLNVVNSENKADQIWVSLPKIQIYYITYYILKMPKIDWPGSQDFPHLDN